MSICAVVALFLLILCFWKCEEKVGIAVETVKEIKEKIPVKKALHALACNKYFWMATGLWTMQACIALFTGTVLPYYCKYVFMDASIYSVLFLVETLTTIIATIIFCPTLLRKFGKRNMSLYGIVLAFLGHLISSSAPMAIISSSSAASSEVCASHRSTPSSLASSVMLWTTHSGNSASVRRD